jgi:hypothetical protein
LDEPSKASLQFAFSIFFVSFACRLSGDRAKSSIRVGSVAPSSISYELTETLAGKEYVGSGDVASSFQYFLRKKSLRIFCFLLDKARQAFFVS